MRRNLGRKRSWWLLVLALAVGLSVVAAGCGGDEEAAPPAPAEPPAEEPAPPAEEPAPPAEEPAPPAETTEESIEGNIHLQAPGQCGAADAQGVPASGDPIKIGAITSSVPVNFFQITNMTKAYFDCVNANGGIHGRPVEFFMEDDLADPQVAVAAAQKLAEDEGVVAFAGGTSFVDCPANHGYYEEKGFNVIVAGVPPECFNTPNIAAVNMGPYYSNTGAAQTAVRQGATAMIGFTNNAPGTEYNNVGALTVAERAGITQVADIHTDDPPTDPNSEAQRLINEAGPGGAVVMAYGATSVLEVLLAAQRLGDDWMDVIWTCATVCNDERLAQGLDDAWNGKVFVNAEFNLTDSTGPDNTLYQQIREQYAPDEPLGSFGQMGHLAGRFLTEALLGLAPEQLDDPAAVNAAIRGIKNYRSDILCKPWYFGDLPTHLPNNADRTVVVEGDTFTLAEDCFQIADVDQLIQDALAAEQADPELTGGFVLAE